MRERRSDLPIQPKPPEDGDIRKIKKPALPIREIIFDGNGGIIMGPLDPTK